MQLEIVSERAIMTNYAATIIDVWRIAEPGIRRLRTRDTTTTYRMFEDLTSRALRWREIEEPKLAARLARMPDTTAHPVSPQPGLP